MAPLPAVPLIAAGAGLVGNIGGTMATNRSSRRLAEYAYRRDLEMWNRQNIYNRPENQMQRLRDAGLNPNLVYGSGSVTGNTAGQMPQYNAPDLEFRPGAGEIASTLLQYNDVQVKQAQADNLQAATENVKAKTATEFVRKANYLTDGQKKKLELSIAQNLEQTTLQTAQQKLEVVKQELTNKQKDAITKDLKNEFQKHMNVWAKAGVSQRDSLFWRSIIQMLDKLGIDSSWLIQQGKKWFNK
mgnify:CR=1 FL=1